MSTKALEFRQQRAAALKQAREILDGKNVTKEDEVRADAFLDEADGLLKKAEREERLSGLEQETASSLAQAQRGENPAPAGAQLSPGDIARKLLDPQKRAQHIEYFERQKPVSPQFAQAYSNFLRYGLRDLDAMSTRALQKDGDPQGGYFLAPMTLLPNVIKFMDDMVFIRNWATVFPVPPGSRGLGAVAWDSDPDDADWTTELTSGNEDEAADVSRRVLIPHPARKRIKISADLLRTAPAVDPLVVSRLGYKFGISAEKAFMTGNGDKRPLGVFTASDDGISTGRDVSTDNTATAFTVDGLINAKYALKSQYWANARWVFHREGVKRLAKLKDGEGQYLWRESVRVGEPDTLLSVGLYASEYAPSTFTASQYVGIIGDFSHYWIADEVDFEVKRADEIYIETNQVGMFANMSLDGMPVLEEAFARVQLGS